MQVTMAPYIRNKCRISVQDNSKGSSDVHFHAKVVVLDKANETESKLSPQLMACNFQKRAQVTQSHEQFSGCCFNTCVLNGFRIFFVPKHTVQTQYLQENITNYQNFKKIFSQMKIHGVRGKRSELKRVGDGCRATDEQFYVWNFAICHAKARKKHAFTN